MVNGVVYAGANAGGLYAFNAISGALLPGWPVKTGGGSVNAGPAVTNGVVYAGSSDDKLYAFNAISGALLPGWPVGNGGTFNQSSPAVANGWYTLAPRITSFMRSTPLRAPYFPDGRSKSAT